MADLIVDKRGLFWRGNLELEEDKFAHESSIAGRLTIDTDGMIELNLDGVLQIEEGRRRFPQQLLPTDTAIAGILFESNEYVWLSDIQPNGGHYSSNGPASETLWAIDCFICQQGFRHHTTAFKIESLSFPLSGFENWLCSKNLRHEHTTDGSVVVSYDVQEDVVYELPNFQLKIVFDAAFEGFGFPHTFTKKIEERVFFKYTPKECLSVTDAKDLSRYVDDLMLIITNLEDHVQWPDAKFVGQNVTGTFYHYRGMSRKKRVFSIFDLWTTFPKLESEFGEIVGNWLNKRDALGSAFYMYTGTRRAPSIYSEHKFMSFILGIESLHRRINTKENVALKTKIKRILDKMESSRDKQWLKSRLKNAHEPSLEERLVDVIGNLPIAFDKNEIKAFAKRCAARRNDLSHFGGTRDAGMQRGFYDDLAVLTPALDILYHAVILNEIGVKADIIKATFESSATSYGVREQLKSVGISVPKE